MTIEPNTIEEIARRIYKDEHIQPRVSENGFVLVNTLKNKAFVGIREDENTYVVGKMRKKSEVVGRSSSSRIKPHENEYIECDLYRINIEDDIRNTSNFVNYLSEMIEDGYFEEKIDTGYINGHRLTPLSRVLDDIFKWYDTS